MATPRHNVIGPTCVSGAENSKTQQLAKIVKIPLQNVFSVTRSRNATQKLQVSNVKYNAASVSPPVVTPPLNTQPITAPRATRTYADVTRGGNHDQDITLSKFLEEFKQDVSSTCTAK
jgi:hypothetical protein